MPAGYVNDNNNDGNSHDEAEGRGLTAEENQDLNKWLYQNFIFLSLKSWSTGQFFGSSNSSRFQWIFKLLIAL